MTRDGLTYVFETAEEQTAFMESEMSREERMDEARGMLQELDRRVLARTDGRGVEPEAIEDALSAMRDH